MAFVKEQRQRDHAFAEPANEVAECPKIEQATIVSLVIFNSVVMLPGFVEPNAYSVATTSRTELL